MTKPLRLTRPEPLEAQVQKAVIRALELHPSIVWVRRMNSGATRTISGGFIRFGFAGCPDIWAQTKDGRLVVVEVKRPSGKATPEQTEFLKMVADNGGISFIARSAEDVLINLMRLKNGG